ncbi:Acyl-CoA thioesterase 2 [Candida viswanathii]|jgi:acyl-CoA thioesterase II|uniref:Acyl-CoA thioesterase 2 n=1 Tax=Candida viswanathii TaxID=5486 RepID=A0A367YLV4_9ASCO|nr:Acyl-CoA thioesterase 2 [Candida viswanathii]RCK66853.1 Acyl-CoA thioesterase 2 [Candida viswanathii]
MSHPTPEEVYGVTKVAENKYVGNRPLNKPTPKTRGVYGGNFCAQAILVAIESAPEGFTPHSIHSNFIRGGDPEVPVEWEVEVISNGKSFANRIVKGVQHGIVVYVATVSLTNKNSTTRNESFTYDTPPDETVKTYGNAELDTYYQGWLYLEVKNYPKQLHSHQISYSVKWGPENDAWKDASQTYQFVGLAAISDVLDLGQILRNLDIHLSTPKFNVSLDHSVYFHGADFDVTRWSTTTIRMTKLAHGRALIEGEMYSDQGRHIASIVQERLYIAESPKL